MYGSKTQAQAFQVDIHNGRFIIDTEDTLNPQHAADLIIERCHFCEDCLLRSVPLFTSTFAGERSIARCEFKDHSKTYLVVRLDKDGFWKAETTDDVKPVLRQAGLSTSYIQEAAEQDAFDIDTLLALEKGKSLRVRRTIYKDGLYSFDYLFFVDGHELTDWFYSEINLALKDEEMVCGSEWVYHQSVCGYPIELGLAMEGLQLGIWRTKQREYRVEWLG